MFVGREEPLTGYGTVELGALRRHCACWRRYRFHGAEERRRPECKITRRLAITAFPTRQRARIYTDPIGRFFLGQSQAGTSLNQASRPLGRCRYWVVAEKSNNCGHIPEARTAVIRLPVVHRRFRNADLFGDLSLKQPQHKPAASQMVAQRVKSSGDRLRLSIRCDRGKIRGAGSSGSVNRQAISSSLCWTPKRSTVFA
jgi:hypothetical protein